MPANSHKLVIQWKDDVSISVDMYNDWFMRFAPTAFRSTRAQAAQDVEIALQATRNLTNIQPSLLRLHPEVLPTLRMSTCPPIAVDRLIGLSGAHPTVVRSMELFKRLPPRMTTASADNELAKIATTIERLADADIFPWLMTGATPSMLEIHRAATIVADRLCASLANPIIRNAQEKRQLDLIKVWLDARGYQQVSPDSVTKFNTMSPGTYSFRMNVPVTLDGVVQAVNIPVDAVIMPKSGSWGDLPLLIEAKSAGDFTNTNKRRKEEAVKMAQLRSTYGPNVRFNLFLCGYFDIGYLSYEAAEGIDWVWEHRIDDLELFGI